MQKNYKIGNAQSIGSYEIQSNYFATETTNVAFAILADGGIDHINGRNSAIIAVETAKSAFYNKSHYLEMPIFFNSIALDIIKNINDRIYIGKRPNLSLTITYLDEEDLYYYIVGDNKLFIFNGSTLFWLNDMNGHYKKKSTDIIGIISNGICDTLNEVEILGLLSQRKHPYDKAQQIIEHINYKNLKNSKNSTIILIEGDL